MKPDTLHSYMLPTGRKLVIRELTASQALEIAAKAGAAAHLAGTGTADAIASAQIANLERRRKASIYQLGERAVSSTVSAEDLLDDMSSREMDCLDAAIGQWADASPAVLRDFLASCDQETAEPQRRPRPVSM